MEQQRATPEELDRAVRQLAEAPAEQAIPVLVAVANRAIIELHKIARQEANARRGSPQWGQWARLANAARSCVLQVAAVRDSLKRLGDPGAGGQEHGSGADEVDGPGA